MKLKVIYLFPRPRRERFEDHHNGVGPDDSFHGFCHLSKLGFETSYDDNPRNVSWNLFHPLEKRIASLTGLGFALPQSIRMLCHLKQADVVVTTADTSGLPVAFLKCLGLLKTPQVYISIGLAHAFRRVKQQSIQGWYARILRSVDRFLVLSDLERDQLQELFDVPVERIHVVPFGVDSNFWKPVATEPGDFLLSVGSDSCRDYATLLKAVGDYPLRIVSRHPDLHRTSLPPNVILCPEVNWVELRELYNQARLVVVTLHDADHPTGQTSALQAMATGRPLVMTTIRALWDPHLRDGTHCLFVQPGDIDELRQQMLRALNDPGLSSRLGQTGRQYVETWRSGEQYAKVLASHIRAASGKGA